MASPSTTSYERPDIGQMFAELPIEASQAGMVGLQVCPIFDAPEKTGVFPKVETEALLIERETKRNPKAGYRDGDWEFTQESYTCQEHGAEERIDDTLKAQYRYAIQFERIAAARAQGVVLRALEKEIADLFFDATTTFASQTAAVTSAWSNIAAAVPVTDVKTALDSFEGNCGMAANAMVMNRQVVRLLTQNAQILDRIKYSGVDDPKMAPLGVVINALEAIFEVDNIYVPDHFRNSAKKGQSTTFARIWPATHVGIYRVATTNDLEEPCVARTFHWSGDGSSPAGIFEQYRDESVRSDVMRFRHDRQVKLLRAECGYVLTGVTT